MQTITRSYPNVVLWVAVALLGTGAAQAQFHHVGSVHNGVGSISDNTVLLGGRAWRHVSAGAQPGGIQSGAAGALDHRAGFLQAVEVRRWSLDTDGDGAPDELDGDNDGDTLADLAELDGSAFGGFARTDPNRPDTDGDGMPDGSEAAGMFDPLDPNHRLAILKFYMDAGFPRMVWIGKGGGWINTILQGDDLTAGSPTNVLLSLPFFGGEPPWFKTTNTTAWADAGTNRFFRVRIEPPSP